jgi:hypothetical protein
MEGMPGRKIADRLVVAAAIVLAVAVGADALRKGHHHSAPRATPQLRQPAGPVAAPVPATIRLVPSSTAFLQRCAPADTSLALAAGPRLVLLYDGPPCHLPPLRLHAVVRSTGGAVLYDGPAGVVQPLAGNYARESRTDARLVLPPAACGARVSISGGGLRATGRVRCR